MGPSVIRAVESWVLGYTKLIKEHIRSFFYVINGELFITNDHPVLVLKNSKLNWVRVENLIIGDLIKSLNGYTEVKSIMKIVKPVSTVYMETNSNNFIVNGRNNYYIIKSAYIFSNNIAKPALQEQIIST